MSKREPGFYWVKLQANHWTVSYWDGIRWPEALMVAHTLMSDADFDEIGPRITPPPITAPIVKPPPAPSPE